MRAEALGKPSVNSDGRGLNLVTERRLSKRCSVSLPTKGKM
jgi:hypothetical protein